MWTRLLAASLGVLATPIAADSLIDAMEASWLSWAETHQIEATALSVIREDGPANTRSIGLDPETPIILASVTKPIIAACLGAVLNETSWSWTTTLGDLEDPLENAGLVVPEDWRDVDLGALSSMSSGLVTDVTQGGYFRRQHAAQTEDLGQAVNSLATERDANAEYVYNNANYAILGVVIAALTGETTEIACQTHVTDPLGLDTAQLSDKWRAMGSAGGWEMSLPELAAFTLALPALTEGAPTSNAGDDASFGGGTLIWDTEDGPFFLMRGALCGGLFGIGDMAIILRREDGVAAAVAIDGCLPAETISALEEALAHATAQPGD